MYARASKPISPCPILVCRSFLAPCGFFAVVDVKDSDLVFSKNPVKLLYDTVKVVSYRVTAVMGMTSIKADPELVIAGDAIINPRQLLKRAAKFRTFPGHRLQSDMARGILSQNFI